MKKIIVSIGVIVFFILGLSLQNLYAKSDSSYNLISVLGSGYLDNGAEFGIGAVFNDSKTTGHIHFFSRIADGKASPVLEQILDCDVTEVTVACKEQEATLICDDGTEVDVIAGDQFDPFDNGVISIWDSTTESYIFKDANVTHGFITAGCKKLK